jgi:hypothetical protein
MKTFKTFITESATRGVDFEWAIVYEALKASGMSDEELIQRNPKLIEYSGQTGENAKKAIKNVPKALWPHAKHSDETDVIGKPVAGTPEPKTDIIFGKNNEYRVSVKMSGTIQLASGEGISSAKMLNEVMTEYLQKTGGIKDDAMAEIIRRIEGMPTKSVSPQNIERVKRERPELFRTMLDDKGKKKENKQEIKDYLAAYTANNPEFLYILIDEALTGKRTFGENDLATANYIITPNKFVEIDNKYVDKVAKDTRIDVRAKSRKGITSAALRFDYKTESIEYIDESIIKKLKKIASGIIGKVKSYFKNLITPSDLKGKIEL